MIEILSRIIHRIGLMLLDIVVLGALFFTGINLAITYGTEKFIFQEQDITTNVDAVLILGASVQGLQLSPILQDRVETAIMLYQNKKVRKIVISGYNDGSYYREVDAMYRYIVNRGIPPGDIITDNLGYDTFDSIKNTKYIENIGSLAIVTQVFHLPRAIFIAQAIGLNAIGIISDRATYFDEKKYKTRESLARIKAFLEVVLYYIVPHA